jgi:hypothetical protein
VREQPALRIQGCQVSFRKGRDKQRQHYCSNVARYRTKSVNNKTRISVAQEFFSNTATRVDQCCDIRQYFRSQTRNTAQGHIKARVYYYFQVFLCNFWFGHIKKHFEVTDLHNRQLLKLKKNILQLRTLFSLPHISSPNLSPLLLADILNKNRRDQLSASWSIEECHERKKTVWRDKFIGQYLVQTLISHSIQRSLNTGQEIMLQSVVYCSHSHEKQWPCT